MRTTTKIMLAAFAVVLLAVPVMAFNSGVTTKAACKSLGDFIDSREWDVELEPLQSGNYGFREDLLCFDPVDARFYEATPGAVWIAMEG